MKVVRKDEAERHADGEVFVAYEYHTQDPDINTARIEIKGRYPRTGSMRNTKVKELVYVESGTGTVSINGVQESLEAGDVVFFESGESVVWEGDFVLITTCTPAWSKDQHEFL